MANKVPRIIVLRAENILKKHVDRAEFTDNPDVILCFFGDTSTARVNLLTKKEEVTEEVRVKSVPTETPTLVPALKPTKKKTTKSK